MKMVNYLREFSLTIGALFMLTGNAIAVDKIAVVPIGGKLWTINIHDADVVTSYRNSIGMNFSLIPAGSFVMGSSDGTIYTAEPGRDSDEIQHMVTLTKSYYMQTTEVTQGQWLAVMGGTNPAYFSSCGMNCPVEWVSWNEAQAFIDALNAKEGRTNCHTTHNTCYSLPTESQWEYAARARTTSAFYSGALTNISCSPTDPNMAKIGWYCGNANNTTHPVAQKNPNHWGLYDMAGNVWEWCQDMYGTYPVGPVTDPSGATYGSAPVFRGGSWESEARWTRSANRGHGSTPHCHWNFVGFRLVLPSGQ